MSQTNYFAQLPFSPASDGMKFVIGGEGAWTFRAITFCKKEDNQMNAYAQSKHITFKHRMGKISVLLSSGSSCTEPVNKCHWYYWCNQGHKRKHFTDVVTWEFAKVKKMADCGSSFNPLSTIHRYVKKGQEKHLMTENQKDERDVRVSLVLKNISFVV